MSDYYEILTEQCLHGEGSWMVRLRPEATVYRGHFPGHPIAPGACNIELIRQLLSRLAGRECRFAEIMQCRFSYLITPMVENPLRVTISLTGDRVAAAVHWEDVLCISFKAKLKR